MPRGTVRERAGVTAPEPTIEGALRHLAQGRGIIPVWSPDLSKRQGENGLHPCMCPKGANCKSPGKHPAVRDKNDGMGFEASFLRDEQSIRTALGNPGTRNYGIIPAPGEVALDLDGEGLQTWRKLGDVLGKPPPTDSQKTRNGWHAFYQISDDPLGNLFGIVTRRHPGGYIVGEGSIHPSGIRYEHYGPRTVAKLPPNYVERANEAREAEKAAPTPFAEVPDGKRHDTLRDMARYMHGRGASDEAVLAALMAANAEFPHPKSPEEVRQAMGDLSRFPVDPEPIVMNIDTGSQTARRAPLTGLTTVRASSITPKKVPWLWKGWMLDGQLFIIEGLGGVGKSTVVVNLVSRITTGRPWPDETPNKRGPTDVLYITGEDDPDSVLVPRLIAADADLDRVHIVPGQFILPQDLPALEGFIAENPECSLVFIDPLSSHFDSDINTGSSEEIRQKVLDPLITMASKYGVSIIASRHLNKAQGSIETKGSGSYSGFTGRARTVALCVTDPDDEDGNQFVFGIHKSNYDVHPSPITYAIQTIQRDYDDPDDTTSCVAWIGRHRSRMDAIWERVQNKSRVKGSETMMARKDEAMISVLLKLDPQFKGVSKEAALDAANRARVIGAPAALSRVAFWKKGGFAGTPVLWFLADEHRPILRAQPEGGDSMESMESMDDEDRYDPSDYRRNRRREALPESLEGLTDA